MDRLDQSGPKYYSNNKFYTLAFTYYIYIYIYINFLNIILFNNKWLLVMYNSFKII